MNFSELRLNEQLLSGLDAMGFEEPTPIQEKAIPIILEGSDLIACAPTGTGKTAAFLLPVLNHLTEHPSEATSTLILVPTRELAVQIDQQLEGFAYFTETSSVPIYGGRDGASFNQEKKALTSGANIIVATPGRLIAHLNMGYVKWNDIQHLILDEADRMLDMGFLNDILTIINFLPAKRQTIMFSATMPHKIRKLAKQILNNAEQISFAVSQPAEGILQGVYRLDDSNKIPLLGYLLGNGKSNGKRILIFSTTKAKVKSITASLKQENLNVGEIHSDLGQDQREEILRKFKNGSLQILVATDILSRGIDVKDINLVLNFDVPPDMEDYIHRIGRTARAANTGVAITLVNRQDNRKFRNIEQAIESKIRLLTLPPDIQEKEDKIKASQPRRNNAPRNKGRGNRSYGSNKGGGGNKKRRNGHSSRSRRK